MAQSEAKREHDRRRGGSAQRLYGYAWQKARAAFLEGHPLCQCPDCDDGRKRVRVATIVDHKKPHRGNPDIFWDRANWQAMNKQCHDSYKQRIEKSGRVVGAGVDGMPTDPRHHWNE